MTTRSGWVASLALVSFGAFGQERVALLVPEGSVGDVADAGAVGFDFDVGTAGVFVSSAGVFDDEGDGLEVPITWRLFDRRTRREVATLRFAAGEGALDGASRFKPLACPLHLPAGTQATVVAEGYGPMELFASAARLDGGALRTDDADGGLAFVATRTGAAGVFPTRVLGDAGVVVYAAATFSYALPCDGDATCTDPSRPLCAAGVCGARPVFFPHCPAEAPACNFAAGTCVACVGGHARAANRCLGPDAPWCDGRGQCVASCPADARCVGPTATPPAGRYLVDAEWVLDRVTGLTWQRAVVSNRSWAEARDGCRDLALSTDAGWRLPSARELASLVNPRASMPAIDGDAFPGTPSALFWSSSLPADGGAAFVVGFGVGNIQRAVPRGLGAQRCVR